MIPVTSQDDFCVGARMVSRAALIVVAVFGCQVAVAADARVEGTRELTRRIVAHEQPHLVAEVAQRGRLQLRVLDNGSPE